MATKETHPYPEDFEKEYATWDEEKKKKAACIAWAIAMTTILKVSEDLKKKDGKEE